MKLSMPRTAIAGVLSLAVTGSLITAPSFGSGTAFAETVTVAEQATAAQNSTVSQDSAVSTPQAASASVDTQASQVNEYSGWLSLTNADKLADFLKNPWVVIIMTTISMGSALFQAYVAAVRYFHLPVPQEIRSLLGIS